MHIQKSIARWVATTAAAFFLATSMWAWLTPARAASLEGAAEVVSAGSTGGQPLTSGGSATDFTLKLPANAACAGDSANANWRWQTYMVVGGVDPATLQFGAQGPTPAGNGAEFSQPLYTPTASPVVNRNTADAASAGGPGPIVNIPAFDFSVWGPGDIPAGTYNVGVACTLGSASATQLDRYWNAQMTFTTAPADSPAQVTWTAASTPPTTTTTVAPTTTTSTTAVATTTTTMPGATTTTTIPGATTTTVASGATTTTSTTTASNSTISLSPASGAAGSTVSVSATGFRSGSQAQVYFLSDPVLLTTVTVTSTGGVSVSVTIPSNAASGSHSIEVRGTATSGAALTKSSSFTVTTSTTTVLSRTGTDFLTPLIWGLVLLALGRIATSFDLSPLRHGLRK